jgi:hypothetical protein
MALVSITPVAASVAFDHGGTRPDRIRFADREVRVVRVSALRDERAAYPAGRSPRLTVQVEIETGEALELVFDARLRRWFVDALDPLPLDTAA